MMLSNYDLFAFDLDGTLVALKDYAWNLFHDAFGVAKDVRKERLRQFKAGELSYEDWVAADVGDWRAKGKRRDDFVEILAREKPISGALEFLSFLKKAGKRIVLISGSIDLTRQVLLPGVAFDLEYINQVHFSADGLISSCTATNYDFEGKAQALKESARSFGVPMARTVFIGDNDNDCFAAAQAGLGIAFNSTSARLLAAANLIVPSNDMADVQRLMMGSAPAPAIASKPEAYIIG